MQTLARKFERPTCSCYEFYRTLITHYYTVTLSSRCPDEGNIFTNLTIIGYTQLPMSIMKFTFFVNPFFHYKFTLKNALYTPTKQDSFLSKGGGGHEIYNFCFTSPTHATKQIWPCIILFKELDNAERSTTDAEK